MKKISITLATSLLASLVLTTSTFGCRGDSGEPIKKVSTKPSKPKQEIINGYTLPPEPDPKINNATLLGVDSNHNGVRDDVERWIYKTYKDKHPIYIDIAMQAARGYRLVLEKQPKTKEEAMQIMNDVEKALYCEMYYKLDAKYFNEPILVNEDIITKFFRQKIYFNTKRRLDVYIKYDTLFSGDSYTLMPSEQRKSACNFDTTKYDRSKK